MDINKLKIGDNYMKILGTEDEYVNVNIRKVNYTTFNIHHGYNVSFGIDIAK